MKTKTIRPTKIVFPAIPYNIPRVIPLGTILEVEQFHRNWFTTIYNGKKGWIDKIDLTEEINGK